MGYGDDLITSSIARKAFTKTGKKAVPGDGNRVYWSEVFDGNPIMAREPSEYTVWVREFPSFRSYIDRSRSSAKAVAWNTMFHVEPGEIYLTEQELDWDCRDFVYIEPNVKGTVYENKDWGFDNWQKVVNGLPGIRFIQGSGRKLVGAEQRETRTFRHAVGLLSHARLFVGADGGLHHAAAAVGKPAVVVWTGFADPNVTGYRSHTNLAPKTRPCGTIKRCSHCDAAKQQITVDRVIEAILAHTGGLQAKAV